jgi:hypothetical protein
MLMALLLFAGILSVVSWAASPESGYMNLYLGVLLIIVVFATCYQTFSQEASADNLMEKFRALVPEKGSGNICISFTELMRNYTVTHSPCFIRLDSHSQWRAGSSVCHGVGDWRYYQTAKWR